jgi:activating signal cointegrator complex subunit 3
MLDVLQIFGRAGRPQFDTSGHGMIITPHSKLHKYLSLLTNQIPIESCFVQHLVNNLNAEVCIIKNCILIMFDVTNLLLK